MSQEQSDSLNPFRRLEEAWKAHAVGGERPDWRSFVTTNNAMDRDDLIAICMTDIECRLKRHDQPPLVQDYAAAEERVGLDKDGLFKLIEFEYQWCWRHYAGKEANADHPVRPVTKAEYNWRFPNQGSCIEGLKTRWKCIRCEEWTEGDEKDDPPRCQHCGFGIDRTHLDLPRQPPSSLGIPPELLTPDPTDPPPAESLGPYRLGRRLEKGGMGVVYAGQHTMTGHPVAIKVATLEFSHRADMRARFLREMEYAGWVRKNNHVVPILYCGEDKGILFLVMPLLSGEPLDKRLRNQGKLSPVDVEKLGREVALGVAAVHEARLVHRDLKPGNIWLESLPWGGWQAALLDFGLARTSDGAGGITEAGVLVGSPCYAAPEQTGGHFDARSDLFGLGCVLYEASTGEKAFPGADPLAVREAVAKNQPKPPREIDPAIPQKLSDLIMHLLQKVPSDRPASAMSVAKTLGWGGPSTFRPCRQPLSRRRFFAAVSVAAVGSVVVGGAWMAWNRATSPNVAISQPPPQPSLAGDLDVRIDGEGNDGRKWIDLDDPLALPLKADDGYKILATVNRPAYGYIVLIKPDGVVKPVYPWTKPGDWNSRPGNERPLTPARPFVFEPPPGKGEWWYPPTGPAGMLTLMMLARETPLPSNEDVAKLIGPIRPQKGQHLKAKAWFENGVLVRGRPKRDPDFEAKAGSDPVLDVQRRVKDQLLGEGKPFTYSLAVAFATEGRSAKN